MELSKRFRQYFQLYTIHSYKSDCVVPLVYILMTNRTKNSYIEVLRQLLILNPQLDPPIIDPHRF